MSVETVFPLEEYLSSSYDPDVEYVDGVLVERNVGDWLHSLIQRNLIVALSRKYPHLYAVPVLRSQTRETRFRLPDVSVLFAAAETKYLVDVAFITIEILSDEDKMTRMMEKLAEYEAKGVPNIWLIDPRLEQIATYRDGALVQVHGDRITTAEGNIELTRQQVFQSRGARHRSEGQAARRTSQ